MIFRQLFDQQSSTYTYLLADRASREAVLIDPVFEQVRRDAALIDELGLRLGATIDTHVHADHVTGAWLLKQRTGSAIAISAASGAAGADRYLRDGDHCAFGGRYLTVRATPGHTNGCISLVLDDESMAFTGDCLLIRGTGRTDFQQGDPRAMYRAVHGRLFTLPESCLLYPAHDYRGLSVTSVGEERRFNPRLGGDLSEDDFAGYMTNLGLPHPHQIDVAVPANLKCGIAASAPERQDEPGWAPLVYTFAGFWEIDPQWLEDHLNAVQVVDVREPAEFTGPLGHIPDATPIPLGELAARAAELRRDRPIVTVCRAGGRSAQATVILRQAGFDAIANLGGGMLRWRADGRAVVNGRL
ncbi:MBL fold metallo-hydrolase [Burkholderia ubonensis]|uniref:rhodanese-like domain-containing protein n=1 Tax=Burkholderia ubonensis TaxID=101571 RepID=UPI00075D32FE|nr:MBL fold metallo-hydrolase [Burkholderia ubonensis]KVX33061.1 MBL fold metallo-hydrolase [Burkholderia ubonensis]KWO63247.1 MBL fold metallo-hydrolase [Burkholderia ubonensis]